MFGTALDYDLSVSSPSLGGRLWNSKSRRLGLGSEWYGRAEARGTHRWVHVSDPSGFMRLLIQVIVHVQGKTPEVSTSSPSTPSSLLSSPSPSDHSIDLVITLDAVSTCDSVAKQPPRRHTQDGTQTIDTLSPVKQTQNEILILVTHSRRRPTTGFPNFDLQRMPAKSTPHTLH